MDKSNIIKKYSNAFKEHGDSDSSVFYPKSRQFIRYKHMLKNFEPGKTILDFGCGLAKLYQYLALHHPDSLALYHGADIVPDFICHNEEKYQEGSFQLIENVEDLHPRKFDVVFSSGAFNMIYGEDRSSYFHYVQEVLTKLFEMTNEKLVVDFMHDDVDYMQDGAFHINIPEMIGFIEKNITSRYSVDRTYMPYEVSFTLYKKTQTENGVYLESR